MRARFLSVLTLFTSSGTLVCCALPALLVTLGFGSALAGFLSSVPWLVGLSHHKTWVFGMSGILLGFAWFMVYGQRNITMSTESCSLDGDPCESAGRFTRVTLWISLAIYLVGFFMAYLYLPIRLYLEAQ